MNRKVKQIGQKDGVKEKKNTGPALGSLLNRQVLWKNVVLRPMFLLWVTGIVCVIIISIIPQGSLTDSNTHTGIDKLARMAVFMFLAFIPTAFFRSIKLGLCMATTMAPLGFVLELAQKYFPERNFSPEDIIANNIGTIVGIVLAIVIRTLFYTGGRRIEK